MNCRLKGDSRLVLLAIIIFALLMSVATTAGAQTQTTAHYKEVHYEFTGNYYPIGDPADGHFFGTWIRRGLTILDSGDVAAYTATGNFDVGKSSYG